MHLDRLKSEPGALADFYQEALEQLGALCERTWFDRLQVVAGDRAARLWDGNTAWHETELRFVAPDDATPRDAAREVFPGCPLTFRLAEALLPGPPVLERIVVAAGGRADAAPPPMDVAEKVWRAQWPGEGRWEAGSPFVRTTHVSLLALVRCEIQAIDQQWSLHRLAVSLPGGETDRTLANGLEFLDPVPDPAAGEIAWPVPDPTRWGRLLERALTEELTAELASVRARQERYLRRELDRIDDYFDGYGRELAERAARSHSENSRLKVEERLAAARVEHCRRREDQVRRHEVRVLPRLDSLLLVAEPAWETTVTHGHRDARRRTQVARMVPRTRRWFLEEVDSD